MGMEMGMRMGMEMGMRMEMEMVTVMVTSFRQDLTHHPPRGTPGGELLPQPR